MISQIYLEKIFGARGVSSCDLKIKDGSINNSNRKKPIRTGGAVVACTCTGNHRNIFFMRTDIGEDIVKIHSTSSIWQLSSHEGSAT